MPKPIRIRACALIIQNDAVLLIEFDDEHGLHYNLPAGGVELGESIMEAVKREASEEAAIAIEVGRLAIVWEYAPHLNDDKHGDQPSLNMIFDCTLVEGAIPQLPERPDPNQTAVKWMPLSELESVWLLPEIAPQIIAYARNPEQSTIYLEATA